MEVLTDYITPIFPSDNVCDCFF